MSTKTGRFMKLPYDRRRPTRARLRQRMWNRDDPHLLTPKVLGWGYTINFAAPVHWLSRVRRRSPS
jgi:hypothetical protein